MWSDKETSKDFLGFAVHASLIKNVVMEDRNLPVTIGLYGDWGSGKSSVLQIIEAQLKDDEDTAVITFDGWAFESFDDAKMSIISGIVDKILECRSWKDELKTSINNCGKKLKENIFSMRSLLWTVKNVAIPFGFAMLSGGTSLIPNIKDFVNGHKDDLTSGDMLKFLESLNNPIKDKEEYKVVHEFTKDFQALIDATQLKRVIILVDDLDRCLPRHIIDTLEVIKLFLNVPKTAFVIAADEGIVADAITNEYPLAKNSVDGKNIGKNYMEKFIQIPYILPHLSDYETVSYVTLLLCESVLSETDFKNVYEDYERHQSKERFRAYDCDILQNHFKNLNNREDLFQAIAYVGQFAPMMADSLRRNPRMIKRFLNAYELRKRLLKANEIEDQTSQFALLKLMLLEQKASEQFRQLHEWCMSSNGISKELLSIEKVAKGEADINTLPDAVWGSPELLNLIIQEPLFSQCNLRELYWVSRDNIVDTMGGTALIPRRIKNLFEAITNSGNTDVMTKKFCDETLKSLSKEDLNDFWTLLDNKILTKPDNKQLFNLYYFLCIDNFFEKAYEKFINILQRIDIAKINLFSMGDKFKRLLASHGNDKTLKVIVEKNQPLYRAIFPETQKENNGNITKTRSVRPQ